MALTSPAFGRIADGLIGEMLREEYESALAGLAFVDHLKAVGEGRETCEISWPGDTLTYHFRPVAADG